MNNIVSARKPLQSIATFPALLNGRETPAKLEASPPFSSVIAVLPAELPKTVPVSFADLQYLLQADSFACVPQIDGPAVQFRKYERLTALRKAYPTRLNETRLDKSGKPKRSRLSLCNYAPISLANNIPLTYRKDKDSLKYQNLQHCESACCPVCSVSKAEANYKDITTATNWWKSADPTNSIYMLTLTVPHELARLPTGRTLLPSFSVVSSNFSKAQNNFRSHNGGIWRKSNGIHHSITSKETTLGRNGWHLHAHVLLFVDSSFDPIKAQADILQAWKHSILKAGFVIKKEEDFTRLGAHITDGLTAEEYVSKYGRELSWGIEKEVSHSISKSGRSKSKADTMISVNPLAFVDLLTYSSTPRLYSLAKVLYVDYIEGMRGVRPVVFSPNLKQLAGIHEARIEQKAQAKAEALEHEVRPAFLTLQGWDALRLISSANPKGKNWLTAKKLAYRDIKAKDFSLAQFNLYLLSLNPDPKFWYIPSKTASYSLVYGPNADTFLNPQHFLI